MSVKAPFYTITPCCPQATLFYDFNIIGTLVADGVYVYNGLSYQEPLSGMWFYSGSCYTIEYVNEDFGPHPIAFNELDISLTIGNSCTSISCPACDIAIPAAFEVYECCDTANVINVNIDTATCVIVGDVWVYNGPGFITATGYEFFPGNCYNVTSIPNGVYTPGPDCTDFTITIYDDCIDAQADTACPSCILGLEYLIFTSCCDDTEILFKGPYPTSTYYGVKEYLGALVNGLENTCYSIEVGAVGDILVPDLAAYNLLPDPPVYVEGLTFSSLSAIFTDCSIYINECPDCITQCYTLYDCDGNNFNTEIDLSTYLNTFITIIQGGVPSGPWYVIENNTGSCNNAVTGFTVDPVVPAPCDCDCYTVIANAKDCAYVDCDGNLQYTGPLNNTPEKFCSLVYPSIIANFLTPTGPSPIYIQNEGLCIDGECPVICYLLEDCEGIEDPIYSTSTSLIPYAIIGQIVVLDNYPGVCWEVIDTAECDCAIDVNVIQSYDGCPECLGTPKYKLTNCDSLTTIVYTTTDLSAYVGEVIIRLDCPGCWIVEEVDLIPSDVPITVDTSYIGCPECARTYYLLEDCTGYLADVITYTDLSAYVGSVIKLEYCPETCWEVSITRDATNAGEVVFTDVEYADCPECLLTLPCICTTVRNDSTTSKEYRYYDCSLNVQFFTLLPGVTSERFCIRAWAVYFPETDYIVTFGDCTQATDADPWTCPPPIYPRRSVQPGYNTPACTIAKYEKISCKSAEINYKQVLYLRYGISNCCPDEDQKWLIKKELIDLDALRDPNYICTVSDHCCSTTSSCGTSPCSCISPISCNSQ